MKDFRDKIKNYKGSPSDQAWERMLIKKEKKKIKFTKSLLYAFLALNVSALIFMSMHYWNTQATKETVAREVAIDENSSNINNSEKSEKLFAATQLNELNKEKINSLTAENNKLINQIKQLRQTIENKTTKFSNLANQNNTSNFVLRPTTPIASTGLEKLIKAERKQVDLTETNPGIFFLPSINNNSIQDYLIKLASEKKPSAPFFYKESIVKDHTKNWYLSLGSNYEYLVDEKQRSIVLGLFRSLGKRFDAGISFEYSNQKERSKYKFDSDVVDQKTEVHGLFLIRFNAFRINKFMFHADAGVGYKIGSLTNRQSSTIENELQYYNDFRRHRGLDLQLGIGGLYHISPRLMLGTRVFLDDENLHTNLNLNYKF